MTDSSSILTFQFVLSPFATHRYFPSEQSYRALSPKCYGVSYHILNIKNDKITK